MDYNNFPQSKLKTVGSKGMHFDCNATRAIVQNATSIMLPVLRERTHRRPWKPPHYRVVLFQKLIT